MWSNRGVILSIVLAVCVYGVTSLEWEMKGLSSFTVPVFMWSDREIFSKNQVLSTVNTGDIEYALDSLFQTVSNKNSKLSTLFNEMEVAPEVVVLFVEPELRTSQVGYIASAFSTEEKGGSFSHLKSAYELSTSSLVMPYATVSEVTLFDDALLQSVDEIKGKFYLSRLPGTDLFSRLAQHDGVISADTDLMAKLTSNNAFSNGVTDVVVVCFDKTNNVGKEDHFAAHDEFLGTLVSSIKASTKGNYVAIYAANRPAASRLTWTFEQHAEAENFHAFQLFALDNSTCNASNGSNCTNTTGSHKVNYFPGPLLEAYILCAILIAMLFTGACAIFSLQTPDKWEAPKIGNKRDL